MNLTTPESVTLRDPLQGAPSVDPAEPDSARSCRRGCSARRFGRHVKRTKPAPFDCLTKHRVDATRVDESLELIVQIKDGRVAERQDLGEDEARHFAGRIDPEVSVRDPGPAS